MDRNINREIFIAWVFLFVVALIYSKFLLSITMMGWTVTAMMDIQIHPLKVRLRSSLLSGLRSFLFSDGMWFSLLILIYMVTFFWSEDVGEWFWRVRTKAPFLFVPLAFHLAPRLRRTDYRNIWTWWVWVVVLSLVLVLGRYVGGVQEMVDLLHQGQPIPTPCHHVRYSLMVAFAALTAAAQAKKVGGRARWIMIFLGLFLAIGLHFLAVRSGIVALYLGGIIWVLFAFHGKKRLVYGAGVVTLMVLAPILAYQWSPSFRKKMDYVQWDWKQYGGGAGMSYSDSERIFSLRAGWQLLCQHPIGGVGVGDLKREMAGEFERMGLKMQRLKFPHNQFLFVLASCGIPLGMVFFFGFFRPLADHDPRRFCMLYVGYSMFVFSFLVENTIENAVGTALTVGMLGILLKEARDEKPKEAMT